MDCIFLQKYVFPPIIILADVSNTFSITALPPLLPLAVKNRKKMERKKRKLKELRIKD